MHILVDDSEDTDVYVKMDQPAYGHDAYGNKVVPPDGWSVLNRLSYLMEGDRPFDVYAGWLSRGFFNPKYHLRATSEGRWTTWIRKQ